MEIQRSPIGTNNSGAVNVPRMGIDGTGIFIPVAVRIPNRQIGHLGSSTKIRLNEEPKRGIRNDRFRKPACMAAQNPISLSFDTEGVIKTNFIISLPALQYISFGVPWKSV